MTLGPKALIVAGTGREFFSEPRFLLIAQEHTMAHIIDPHITTLGNHSTQQAMSQPSISLSGVVPVAQLLTIDVGRLQEGDKAEAAKVLRGAKEDGAFYLDFSDRRCVKMMEMVENIFALSKDLFQLSEKEKMIYDIDLL